MLGTLRRKYQEWVAPIGVVLGRLGFSPNLMTALSIVTSILSGYVYAHGMYVLGSGLIILTGVFDMFDGAIARATDSISKFGATLDHVMDRYAELFIVVGIAYGGYTQWIWAAFTLFGMVMASYTRAKAESIGGLTSCTVGVAERQEKLLILIAGSIASMLFSDSLHYALILVGAISHITVVQRLYYTWKMTSEK